LASSSGLTYEAVGLKLSRLLQMDVAIEV